MKLFLPVSAALAVLSTGVECFVPSGGYAPARGFRPNTVAANAAFVQPIRYYAPACLLLCTLDQLVKP